MMTFSELVETLKARTPGMQEAYSIKDAVHLIMELTNASYADAYQAYIEGESVDAAVTLLEVHYGT